jgi:hypothetical protein
MLSPALGNHRLQHRPSGENVEQKFPDCVSASFARPTGGEGFVCGEIHWPLPAPDRDDDIALALRIPAQLNRLDSVRERGHEGAEIVLWIGEEHSSRWPAMAVTGAAVFRCRETCRETGVRTKSGVFSNKFESHSLRQCRNGKSPLRHSTLASE